MIKVMLVDDHELVRTGFRHILDGDAGIEVVGEAESGEEALEMIPQLNPDLVMMDINMPGIGGIEATRRIKRHHPDIHVITLTIHGDDPFPTQLYAAGAIGYLTKGCAANELLEAIRSVAQGNPFISREVAQKLTISQFAGKAKDSILSQLTEREMQVLMMVVQGMRNQDISDALCLSPKTISTYRHRLYDRLEVKSEAELIFFAINNGLIEPTT